MTRRLTVQISDELYRELKLYCAFQDLTFTQTVSKALRDFVLTNATLITKLKSDNC
jgi:hypothetical protein